MTPIEQIKDKIDIVEFIGSYIQLKPAGKNFKANCPFHSEKTPSFMVSPERQTWHCFGSCAEGGDVFKFLMKHENLEFYEALKILAEKAGVELKKISPTDQKQFGVLYDINESAKKFFQSKLERSDRVKQYLQDRGLTSKTIEEFEIGFAAGGFEDLTLDLINLGYDIKDIERSGLNFKSDRGNYIDRFRNRIMFPIYNHFGKVVGFSGRILPEFDTGEMGKYINSPETLIFNKSRILYGFHKSKNFIHQLNKALLVEGQMDFLMCWQDGIKNVVATSGTALTQDHLKSIKKQTDNIIFSFDNDEAGLKAAERSIDLANSLDFNVKILILKDFKDPAEVVVKNPGLMAKFIEKSQGVMEFYFNRYLIKATGNFSDLKKNIRIVLAKIKNLSSPIEKNHWIKELSQKIDMSEQALMEEMEQAKNPIIPTFSATKEEAIQSQYGNSRTRREMISERIFILFLADGEFKLSIEKNSKYLPPIYQEIFKKISGAEIENNPEINKQIDLLSMKAGVESGNFTEEKLKKELAELLKQLKQEYCKEKQNDLAKAIKQAEKTKDENKLQELLKQFDEIAKLLQNN